MAFRFQVNFFGSSFDVLILTSALLVAKRSGWAKRMQRSMSESLTPLRSPEERGKKDRRWLDIVIKERHSHGNNIDVHQRGMDKKDVVHIKMLTPWKESYDQPRECIRKQRHYFVNKGPSSQSYGFSSGHVWMWHLDYKESWALKNWCFWTVVLEKTLESPLDCKEIQLVHP